MKKGYIISFILGAIIFGTIGVMAANTIEATNVTYKNTTVESAIDDLYTKATTYKKLDTLTNELTSSDLLSGKQGYKADGTVVNGNISTYNGNTNITPTSETQTLSTSGKYMNSDITINPVVNSSSISSNLQLVSNLKSDAVTNKSSVSLTISNVDPGTYLLFTIRTSSSNYLGMANEEYKTHATLSFTGNYTTIDDGNVYALNVTQKTNIVVTSNTDFTGSTYKGYLYTKLYKVN